MRAVTLVLFAVFVVMLLAIPRWLRHTTPAPPGPDAKPCAPRIYPPESVRAREQGITWVDYRTGDDGRVIEAGVARSSGYARLDDAALQHIRTCRFRPNVDAGVLMYKWFLD